MPFVCMVKLKLVAQFPVDHLAYPVESRLKLFFYASLLRSLTMGLIVLYLSPQNLHQIFYWLYSDYYYITRCEFFTSVLADGVSLESKCQQVSSSLQDSLNYNRYYRHLMFHSFFICFNSLARSEFLPRFSLSFIFILWSARMAKWTIRQVPFFLFRVVFWLRLGFTQLILCSFGAYLLHSLIIWLNVSYLSPHYLHLIFCGVLSIFALKYFIRMLLFYVAIVTDSFSFLRFPFLHHHHHVALVARIFLTSLATPPYRSSA